MGDGGDGPWLCWVRPGKRGQLGAARAEAWELVSLVSPLLSQPLLTLVAAGGTGFACSGTPVPILWHPRAGIALLPVSIPGCVFPPPQHAGTGTKGLTFLPVQSYWWDWECCLPRGGARPHWPIKS